MRDILLTVFILGSVPFILRRPQLGVLMYVWISVMNPHRLTWSFAHDFPFAQYVALATLVGMLFSKDIKRPPSDALLVLVVLLAVWTGVTTLFAFHTEESYKFWEMFLKTQLIVIVLTMLFHRKEDVRVLIWIIVLSVSYYGTKGGLWTLLHGGDFRVYGPGGSYIEDNNALAVALVIVIPLMRYLQMSSPHKSVRWVLIAMMVLCGIAVLGTYSRGALLAVVAMSLFLWWKGRHKLPVMITVLLVLPIGFTAMPEKWHDRMGTINTYDEDSSAKMRLNSWETMWNVAKDRPLVGGGFEIASQRVYSTYSPSPVFPPQVAHSIYFEALGSHGFVGLVLYLLLFGALWYKAGSVARLAGRRPELGLTWARDFCLMLQVSLVGFMVGGAFLSLLRFDVPYYLIGVMVVTLAIVEREVHSADQPLGNADAPRPLLAPGVPAALRSK